MSMAVTVTVTYSDDAGVKAVATPAKRDTDSRPLGMVAAAPASYLICESCRGVMDRFTGECRCS